jgi:hypothetical protein
LPAVRLRFKKWRPAIPDPSNALLFCKQPIRGLWIGEYVIMSQLSVWTVEVRRANIKAKLKLKLASELIRYAVRWSESQGAGQS